MRVFCGTLLADLAVPDIMTKLRQAGASAAGLDADTLTVRLEQLVQWGNLLRSSHAVNASSISEYQRSRSRYQLSKLGERIQRDADGVLAEADAAREVSNELLALVERGLRELADLVTAPGGIEPQEGLERISTCSCSSPSSRTPYATSTPTSARCCLATTWTAPNIRASRNCSWTTSRRSRRTWRSARPGSRRRWTPCGHTSRLCWTGWTPTPKGSPGSRRRAKAAWKSESSAAGAASSRTGRACAAGSATPTAKAARSTSCGTPPCARCSRCSPTPSGCCGRPPGRCPDARIYCGWPAGSTKRRRRTHTTSPLPPSDCTAPAIWAYLRPPTRWCPPTRAGGPVRWSKYRWPCVRGAAAPSGAGPPRWRTTPRKSSCCVRPPVSGQRPGQQPRTNCVARPAVSPRSPHVGGARAASGVAGHGTRKRTAQQACQHRRGEDGRVRPRLGQQ